MDEVRGTVVVTGASSGIGAAITARLQAAGRPVLALARRPVRDAAAALIDGLADRLADGGRIVLIRSRTMGGKPGRSEYAATKAALPALARSWASELAPRRVTVNVVAPGPTATPMLADPRRGGEAVAATPLGRPVHPDEVAALVEYLLGRHAAMITGQTIMICAGASLP